MNRTAGIIVAVIVVLGLGVGILALSGNKSKKTGTEPTATTQSANTTSTNENTTPSTSTQSNNQPESTSTITYTNSGFSPATLTVKAGTTVTIINNSSRVLQFDSDPHPAHTDDPELNVGSISPGQSKTVTVTKTGSHGYHNHLNDEDRGTLVVQ